MVNSLDKEVKRFPHISLPGVSLRSKLTNNFVMALFL